MQFICEMNGIIIGSEDTRLKIETTCSRGMSTNYGITVFPIIILDLLL